MTSNKSFIQSTLPLGGRGFSRASLDHHQKNSGGEKKMVKKRQTGKSNYAKDKKLKAKSPGKRRSKSGKTYTERRRNRSDYDRRRRI